MYPTRDIYFVKLHNFVKIGTAVNVHARIRDLQRGCPYILEIIRVIPNCMQSQEFWLHAHFKHVRLRSEWFHFVEEMLTIEPPPWDRLREEAKERYKLKGRKYPAWAKHEIPSQNYPIIESKTQKMLHERSEMQKASRRLDDIVKRIIADKPDNSHAGTVE